jgi:hypothetical protein
MTRRIIFIVAVVVVTILVWLAGRAFFAPPPLTESSAAWPYGLGSLNDFAKRYPPHEASTNANEIVRIAKALDVDMAIVQPRSRPSETMRKLRQSFVRYLASEVAKSDDSIDEPPPDVKQYLDEHRAALDELRAQLIANSEPRWALDIQELWTAPEPNGSGHFDLFAIFASDALQQRRAGTDVVAWQDLEATWKLARGLWSRPDFSAALSGTRLMNDVAWKMRAPAPPWWREVLAFDADRAAATSVEYEAWLFVEGAKRYPAGEPDDESSTREHARRAAGLFLGPLRIRQAENYAGRLRNDEIAAARSHNCADDDVHHRRVRRFIVEREGVAKLLALKAAGWPPSPVNIDRSTCSDRTWRHENGTLSISKPIPGDAQQRILLPLTWHH